MSDRRESIGYSVALAGFVSPAVQRAIAAAGTREYVPGPSRAAAYRMAGKFVVRMVPWISAAELGVVLWEINHRRNDTLKETVKVGPLPSDPVYVPPGWTRFEERTVQPTSFWVQPGKYFTWDGSGAVGTGNWGFSKGSNESDVRLGFVSPIPNFTTVYQCAWNTSNNTILRHAKWLKDGTGPGTSTVRYGDVIEWEPPQHYWKVHPDVVPTVLPDITNPGQRQRQAIPIPQRDLWKLPRWRQEFGDLVYRESASPAPSPVAPPVTDPGEIPQRPPFVPPGEGPDDLVITPVGPATHVRFQSNSHEYRPVMAREREVKLRANTRTLAYKIMNVMTETHDFVTAVHKALPKRCRRSRSWRGADGKWHRALVSSMMRDIYRCAGDLNVQRAIIYVIANQLQDAAIGRTSCILNDRTGRMFGSTGIQGAGTRLSHAQSGADGHWSTVITDAGDWLAAQSPGWSVNQLRRGPEGP